MKTNTTLQPTTQKKEKRQILEHKVDTKQKKETWHESVDTGDLFLKQVLYFLSVYSLLRHEVVAHCFTCRRIKSWYECVEKAGLTKNQSKQLWTTVKDHFEVCVEDPPQLTTSFCFVMASRCNQVSPPISYFLFPGLAGPRRAQEGTGGSGTEAESVFNAHGRLWTKSKWN